MGNKPGRDADLGAVGTHTRAGDDAAAHMTELSGLSSRVEVSIRCNDLLNMDSGPNDTSDPLAVVYLYNGTQWQEVGRTEVIANNLNPVFVRKIIMQYRFEEVQSLRVDVYDVDTAFINSAPEQVNLAQQEHQGFITCTLAEVCGSMGRTLTKPLTHTSRRVKGTLTLAVEELPNQNASVRFKLRGENFPSCQPFVRVSRTKELMGGALETTPVYRTEVVMRFQSPKTPSFNQFEINAATLCQGDFFRPIVLEVLDWKKNGQHKLLGQAKTSPDEILRKGSGYRVKVEGAKGFPGQLHFEVAQLISHPSFLDYIRGGCELNFMVAIDFTASNGNPLDRQSLHYIEPSGQALNQYQAAISMVGEVLQFYDTDKRYPVYGFGGQFRTPMGLMPVSHCFAVNGNESNPEVSGIEGILQAYAQCIRSVTLAGPTIFSQVLAQASRIATQYHRAPEQKYFVLLILTDGVINDMDATVNEIVRASALPLSVLIVGVGGADFSNMQVLDGDDVRLQTVQSGPACRDIVQFVSMRDFISPQGINRTGFSKALLEELPMQMTSYFALHKIAPNAPLPPPPLHASVPVMPPSAPI